jgi:hemerythrin
MKLIDLGKEQEIGIQLIDAQHREIVNTINHLYEIKDHEKKEILETFDSLVEKLKIHFDSEENLMKENNVVRFISHKLEHDRAYSKYADYYNHIKSTKNDFDPEILISLKNWIENHIVKKDMKLKSLVDHN